MNRRKEQLQQGRIDGGAILRAENSHIQQFPGEGMCIALADSGDQNHEEPPHKCNQETQQTDAKLLGIILPYQVDTEGNRTANEVLDGRTRIVVREVVVGHSGQNRLKTLYQHSYSLLHCVIADGLAAEQGFDHVRLQRIAYTIQRIRVRSNVFKIGQRELTTEEVER